MAMGVAVLSRPLGAIAESVIQGRNGRLVSSDSASDFVAALGEWIDEPTTRAQIMRTNQRDFLARVTMTRSPDRMCSWLMATARGRVNAFQSGVPSPWLAESSLAGVGTGSSEPTENR